MAAHLNQRIDESASQCVDTLRLSPEDCRSLIDQLDLEGEHAQSNDLRIDNRVAFEAPSGSVLKIQHPGGSDAFYLVRPRNISRTGIGFLHGNFIHTGSKAALILTTMESTRIEVHGQIVRCRHVRDRVHDIGMKFDIPIDLSHLVSQAADADADEQTGLDLPQFAGRVLYVDDQIEEQRLLKFHLESLGVELVLAITGDEALHTVDRQRFDAVFSVLVLTDMTGPDLFEALKSNGYSRPIVVMSANNGPDTQSQIVDHGCSAFLAKPYTVEQLADVLKDVLPSADADGADGLLSTEWHNERMRPLIRQYLDKLQEHVVELATAIEQQGEMDLIQKLCLDIKGSSGSYGFPQISENAATIHQALADQDAGPVESIVRELIDPALKELRQLCDAAHRSVASV